MKDKHDINEDIPNCHGEPTAKQIANDSHEILFDGLQLQKVRCVDCSSLTVRNCITWCKECEQHKPTTVCQLALQFFGLK